MYRWNVYYEKADGNTPSQFIGTIDADTQADALEQAAQFYEIPPDDLVIDLARLFTGGN